MDSGIAPTGPDEAGWAAIQRGWTRGWRRLILPVVFLVYLVYVGEAVAQHSPRAAIGGYVILGVFVASQAPVLFSRDLRHGTIALYLARPLRSSTYAVARWASLLGATLVFLVLPILILYAVGLLAELRGEASDLPASLAGSAEVTLADGRLVARPVIRALLNTLSVAPGGEGRDRRGF